jgi:hypothetical protein
MRRGGIVVGAAILLACGGRSTRSGTSPAGDSGGTSSASVEASGAAADPGSAGGLEGPAGGAGAGDLRCTGFANAQRCIETCFTEAPLAVTAVCDAGAWRCPAGAMRSTECPPESCSGSPRKCCDSESGADSVRGCSPEGTPVACPDGFDAVTSGALCAPAAVGVTSCEELDGLACDDLALHCSEGGGCGRVDCVCAAAPDGRLLWRCYFRLC